MMISLCELKVGETAHIANFDPKAKHFRHKLQALGLTIGTAVTLLRIAPLGDPIAIQVRGCTLSIRKQDASYLLMKRALI